MAKKNETSNAAPTAATNSIFQTTMEVDTKQFTRKNVPQILKAADMPVGGGFQAEIVSIVDSPVSTIKGKLLWLKNAAGAEFTFPLTGDVRSSLAPGKDGEELEKVLKPLIGKTLVVKRGPNKAGSEKNIIKLDVFTN